MNITSSLPPLLCEIPLNLLSIKQLDPDQKLVISYDFPYPILFTGLAFLSLNTIPEKIKTMFKPTDIEGYLDHNGERITVKPLGFQEGVIEKGVGLHAVGYLSSFRVGIINHNNSPDAFKLFSGQFSSIHVHGFSLHMSPNASSVIPLLNISELFNKNHRYEDLHETNILLGLALINARRFLQAAEVLRRSAAFYQSKPGKGFKAAKIQLLVAEAIKQPSMINEKMQAYYRATELFLGRGSSNANSTLISCNFDVYTALLRIAPHLCKFLVKMLYEKLDPLKIASVRGLEFLLEYLGCSISSQLGLILKTIILTYPLQQTHEAELALPLSAPIHNQLSMKYPEIPKELIGTENQQTQKLLVDIYNHLLESFLNVLTSASSFLLRGLFLEIIAPNIFLNEMNAELRMFVFRIAEKITAICQGDLEINLAFVAALVQYHEGKQLQSSSLRLAAAKLWESIKTKVIVNFTQVEARKLGDWVLENMRNMQESGRELSGVEIFIEIVRSLCARERKNFEIWGSCGREVKNYVCSTNLMVNFEGFEEILTLLIEDLLVANTTAQFSSNNVGSVNVSLGAIAPNGQNFQQNGRFFDGIRNLWQCLLEVLNCMEFPLKHIHEISFRLLRKTSQIISEKSPSIQVLNAILLIFRTLEEFKQELPDLFLTGFFGVFCECIPHSVYDESFLVFELLLKKVAGFLQQEKELIEKAINSLIDQFTVRSKAQKQAKNCLISMIKSQQSMETLHEAWSYTLFDNIEPMSESNLQTSPDDNLEISIKSNSLLFSGSTRLRNSKNIRNMLNNNFDSKQFNQNHEFFIEKLGFAEKLFEDLNEEQFLAVMRLLKNPSRLHSSVQRLLVSGNAKVRLKGLKIVRIVLDRFLKSRKNCHFFDFLSCQVTKFVLFCVKTCWEKSFSDPKLHFNGLLLLDQLFQTALGTPNTKFELGRMLFARDQLQKPNYIVIDIFNYEFPEDLRLSFEDDRYLHLRLFQILRLMPSVSGLMNSSWSNIRSLAYGLVCYWVKSDVTLYKPSLMKNLLHSVFGVLLSLLTSKESECRTGGLNILGSFCGFGFDFQKLEIPQILGFFRRFEAVVSQSIWESVFEIQNDWDGTNQAAAVTLLQLAAPKPMVMSLFKLKKEYSVLEYNNTLHNTNNQGNQGCLGPNKELLLEMDPLMIKSGMKSENSQEFEENSSNGLDENGIFWMEKLKNEELQELIAMFRNEYKPPQNLWIERANYNEDDIEEDYDRFIYEADEVGNFFFEENSGNGSNPINKANKAYADEFDENGDNNLEDLGIIEVNDEEWNEYYSEELKTLKNHKSNKKGQAKTTNFERRSDNAGNLNSNSSAHPLEKIKKNNEEKKIDEKAALRPHNPLFRPLTPPIADTPKDKLGGYDFGANMDNSPVMRTNNFEENAEVGVDFNRNRPNSGNNKMKTDDFFKRRDSAELFEMRCKEKSSSNSQKSEEDSKTESPLMPILGVKQELEKEDQEQNIEKIEKSKKCPKISGMPRKSLDKDDLDELKSSNNSTKLLQKLLETLQMGKKTGVIEKMLKRQGGSPNKDLLDNLLDSLKRKKNTEKTRSSSLGKKSLVKNKQKKTIGANSNNMNNTNPVIQHKEKGKMKRNAGLKKRAKVNRKEEENETL